MRFGPAPGTRALAIASVRRSFPAGLAIAVSLTASAAALADVRVPGTFSGPRAMAELVAQVQAGPRIPGTPSAARTLTRIERQVRTWVRDVRREPFEHEGQRMTNLVARLAPGRGRPILVAAHWDTRRWCDRDPDPRWQATPLPGANDGASGAAVLVELARALSGHPLEHEVRLVWFDGEDWGREADDMFLGARAHLRAHLDDPPDWGILLDMVGERGARIPREGFSEAQAPGLLRAIYRRARTLGLSGTFPDVPGQAVLDDHTVFLDRGIPVVDLIDFDYPEWHTHGDTPDRCSAESLEDVGRLVMSCILDPPVP
jgi:hypothetical protein